MKKKLLLISALFCLISCSGSTSTSNENKPVSVTIINPISSSDNISSEETISSNTSSEEDISIISSEIITSKETSSETILSSEEIISSEEVSSEEIISTPSSDKETSSSIISSSSNDYDGYYKSIDFSKTGDALKQDLYNLIKKCDMSKYTYKTCDSYVANANEDPNNSNNLIEFYTGRSVPKNYYPTSSSMPDAWNKEHVYAKSHGDFASQIAGKDIHHLMPTVNGVNGKRSNKDFDECSSSSNAVTSYKSYGQTITVKYADSSDICYTTSSAFEPRDAVKGDVARILFYMATRYEGNSDGGPDLELVDSYTSSSSPTLGKLSTLLKWHKEDPVDEFEMKRNNYIYSVQENRNPYIDHPELAEKIF